MKRLLKKIVPERLWLRYHWCVTMCAALWYQFPSRQMIVIGVTGTKGKTSTANFIWSCLEASGHTTGIISTANIRIGQSESLNDYHMTMPGRFAIQRLLRQMVASGCGYCVVETTSEGLKQYRHAGIAYDIAVFTNLFPEHLQSHGGSFEEYRRMKGKLFSTLGTGTKIVGGRRVEKVIIANADSEHASYFLGFPADRRITFSLNTPSDVQARAIAERLDGVNFLVGTAPFSLHILGTFNVYNALPAIVIARLAGASDDAIRAGLHNLRVIPGRMEKIETGQDFIVVVDYAHEKESMTQALTAARTMARPDKNVIVLLGAEGGGRDKDKRLHMGELAARMAEQVIVSNVDPYDDDPKEIVEDIARAAEANGKMRDTNLFVIEDRKEGIRKALSLARTGDVVLITGKGAEQSMIIGGNRIPWDDRTIVRELLS